MAIKINLMPKKEGESAVGETRRPFYFLIIFILFIISSLIYIAIYSYNTFFLEKQLDAIDKKSADIREEVSKTATAEDLTATAAAITKGKNVKSILSSHYYSSKIYELLEELTIKSVSYDKFSEKTDSGDTISVSIAGEADNLKALAKQLIIFKKSKEIKELLFKEASMEKNSKVSFSIILSLDSKLIFIRPVVTLIGFNSIEIIRGSAYSDAGATAIDGVDGPLAVAKTGSVNTNIVGTYTLTYSAVNSRGNSATAIRTVNVAAPQGATIPK